MATRNIVPRASGEGNLGTSAKPWLGVYATKAPLMLQYAQTTSDRTTTSTSFSDVTGMTGISLKAGGVYMVRVRATVTTNSTSVGVLLSLNTSAAVSSVSYIHRYPTSATAFTEENVTAILGGTMPSTGPGGTNTPYVIDGVVTAASDCTLDVQFRSETATTTTVKAGSFIEVTRIS